MRTFVVLSLLAITNNALAQSGKTKVYPAHRATSKTLLKPVDKKFGFRDVLLESPLSAHPEMQRTGDSTEIDDPVQIYKRPSDELIIGSSSVDNISYIYYNNKLSAILINLSGFSNWTALQDALEAKYGKADYHVDPDDDSSFGPYLWKGSRATLMLTGWTTLDDSSMLLSSNALRKLVEAANKRRAAKGL